MFRHGDEMASNPVRAVIKQAPAALALEAGPAT
jgi:hypothetical protein